MRVIDTFLNYEDLQNQPFTKNIRRQREISKHHQKCVLQFSFRFKSAFKIHQKRPQQTATTTIFKGNPPKLTKRKKKQ